MSKDCKHKDWQERTAMTQKERFSDALNPGSLELMDFSIEKWMEFAFNFAEKVNYFDESSSGNPSGNWEKFFIQKEDIKNFVKNLDKGETTPHLALFACFLYLLELPRSSFNKLTKRHLDYYYQEVLQIKRKPAEEDQVYLVFELAKNMTRALIDSSNLLDGGKDANGKRRIYAPTGKMSLNMARVTEIRNVMHHVELKEITCAQLANSLDGLGEALEEGQSWYPFGHPSNTTNFKDLPKPRLGFVICAEVLRMAEGKRTIILSADFPNSIDLTNEVKQNMVQHLNVLVTGKKDWLPVQNMQIVSATNTKFELKFELPKSEEALVDINPETHGLDISANLPALSLQIIMEGDYYYDVFEYFSSSKPSKITLEVDVDGVESLNLSNDQGVINAKKPFFPFGSIPIKGSNFTIDYPELFSKQWDSIKLTATWKNLPDSFSSHYAAYSKSVNNNSHFKANRLLKNSEGEFVPSSQNAQLDLFNSSNSNEVKVFNFSNPNIDFQPNGPVRLALASSFYHELFPKLYALAMTSNLPNGPLASKIPNEPYTPLMERILMSYGAKAEWDSSKHQNEQLHLYHLHPFGVSESINSNIEISLLPTYKAGELFIGIENAEPNQLITMLFQLDEGSENPLEDFYESSEGIQWSVLCAGQWKKIESKKITKNETDNFLKTGIFQFVLPDDATIDNKLMPSGQYWLRAVHSKTFDAVCRFLSVHAQVVLAKFQNNNNLFDHVIEGLPKETISKLVVRLAEIKKIEQPYASFGGRGIESDEHYYIRVSERLRHKDRAITVWDYEHLVLEYFPKIHKVKSLNHSSKTSYSAPGHVTLVVVPNTVNQTVFDIYQPRVSQATLNEIEAFLKGKNSSHVDVHVVNPSYEEIQVSVKVKFRAAHDFETYKGRLQEDLLKLLAPWAFNQQISVHFEAKLYRSQVIDYLEKLDYVDYLMDFQMFKIMNGDDQSPELIVDAIPSTPMAILVSAKEHKIYEVKKDCAQLSNSNTSEAC